MEIIDNSTPNSPAKVGQFDDGVSMRPVACVATWAELVDIDMIFGVPRPDFTPVRRDFQDILGVHSFLPTGWICYPVAGILPYRFAYHEKQIAVFGAKQIHRAFTGVIVAMS